MKTSAGVRPNGNSGDRLRAHVRDVRFMRLLVKTTFAIKHHGRSRNESAREGGLELICCGPYLRHVVFVIPCVERRAGCSESTLARLSNWAALQTLKAESRRCAH